MYAPSQSSNDTLKALIAFYQDEKHWVRRTRVVLQSADDSDGSLSIPMDTRPDVPMLMDNCLPPSLAYPNPVDEDMSPAPIFLGGVSVDDSRAADQSYPVRRPGRTRLQIDDLLIQPRHADIPPRSPSPSDLKSRILNTFSDLMDARIESCQRMSRLVEMGEGRLF